MRHNLDSFIVSFSWRRLDLKYRLSQKGAFFKATFLAYGNFTMFRNIVLIFLAHMVPQKIPKTFFFSNIEV